DSIFYHTYMVTATTDLDRALWIADSLYNSSRTDLRKIRSLMLISDMYHRKADRDSSLHYAALASNIAEAANIYDWQARINGVLSTQYRKMGLLNQGKVYLEKGLEASKRMEPGHKADQFMGQVYQEKGSYALEEEEFGQAINHFRTAQTFHNTLTPSPTRAVFLSHTEEQLGTAFL